MSLCFCPIQFSFQINGLQTIFPKNSHCVLLPVPCYRFAIRFCIQPLSQTYAQLLGILNCINKVQKASQLHQRSYGYFRVPNGLERREGSKRRGGLCCQIKAKGVRALRTRKWAVCASGVWPGVGRLGLTVLAFAYTQFKISGNVHYICMYSTSLSPTFLSPLQHVLKVS